MPSIDFKSVRQHNYRLWCTYFTSHTYIIQRNKLQYIVSQGCTNPERLVARATKFCAKTPNIFSIITAFIFPKHKNLYHFTCTEQKVQGESRIVGPQAWNLLYVTLLAPRMETASRFVQNLLTPAVYGLNTYFSSSQFQQDKQCAYKLNFQARSRDNGCRGNAISITYSEYVFVALIIQHAKRMRRIVMSSVTCMILPYFIS